jgi:hypothetical protein
MLFFSTSKTWQAARKLRTAKLGCDGKRPTSGNLVMTANLTTPLTDSNSEAEAFSSPELALRFSKSRLPVMLAALIFFGQVHPLTN